MNILGFMSGNKIIYRTSLARVVEIDVSSLSRRADRREINEIDVSCSGEGSNNLVYLGEAGNKTWFLSI